MTFYFLFRLEVVDVETRKKLPPGETGEILVKGPTCFKGYLDMAEATAAVFDEEGFLKTGKKMIWDAYTELTDTDS